MTCWEINHFRLGHPLVFSPSPFLMTSADLARSLGPRIKNYALDIADILEFDFENECLEDVQTVVQTRTGDGKLPYSLKSITVLSCFSDLLKKDVLCDSPCVRCMLISGGRQDLIDFLVTNIYNFYFVLLLCSKRFSQD